MKKLASFVVVAAVIVGCAPPRVSTGSANAVAGPKVGPAAGTVVVVGGGVVGPEILTRFIEAAGGPDALIIDVPTAGGAAVYPANWSGMNALKAAGARNVMILHTVNKAFADSARFAEPLTRAGGVWFEGGRQWHLVDSYAGTKTEAGFHSVLARGGVVGGSSAGASILSSYMLRGAREGNETVMAPGYEVGFGFLRGVAIDQHVVARERLRDLADSLIPRRPDLLGISEDEGTAWFVKGDVAEIVGRNKAFVYNGKTKDEKKPFLTLYPGDRYDLGERDVVHRASSETRLTSAYVDSLFSGVSGKATVLVAKSGKVLVDRGYNIPDHPLYMPATTVPNFALGAMAGPLDALVAQLAPPATRTPAQYQALVNRALFTPIGAHKTVVDTTGAFASNVDELYRYELGMQSDRTFGNDSSRSASVVDYSRGWTMDSYRGFRRWSAFATPAGERNAFVRVPEMGISVIILTDQETLDAKAIAGHIIDRLMP